MQTAVASRGHYKSAEKLTVGFTVNINDGNQATGSNQYPALSGVQADFVLASEIVDDGNLVRPGSADE